MLRRAQALSALRPPRARLPCSTEIWNTENPLLSLGVLKCLCPPPDKLFWRLLESAVTRPWEESAGRDIAKLVPPAAHCRAVSEAEGWVRLDS